LQWRWVFRLALWPRTHAGEGHHSEMFGFEKFAELGPWETMGIWLYDSTVIQLNQQLVLTFLTW